jgi:hypothetical protein
MFARGSHNIILINSCNKFSIELTLIQYPLFISDRILNKRSYIDIKESNQLEIIHRKQKIRRKIGTSQRGHL